MSKICSFLTLIIIALALSSCKEERELQQPVAAASPAQEEKKLPKIVAFGNSLTAGLGLPLPESYPAMLQKMLDTNGYKYEVVNAGVSGDTTSGGLRRLDWSLDDQAEILILELGGNDILRGQPVSLIRDNLAEMIEKAQTRNVRVLLAGIEAPSNAGPEYRKEVHDAFQGLANQYNIPFIPFFLKDVVASEKLIQEDGTHPTAEGARLIAQHVYTALAPMLNKD